MPNRAYRLVACLVCALFACQAGAGESRLRWQAVAELPDATGGPGGEGAMGPGENLGVAGPFAGVHNDRLIVAGGANFPIPEGRGLWDPECYKRYEDRVWVLSRRPADDGFVYRWLQGPQAKLPSPRAYGTSVSTPLGVLCVGGVNQPRDAQGNKIVGDDGKALPDTVFADCFLLRWEPDRRSVVRIDLPGLPVPSVYGCGAMVGDHVYVAVGQTGVGLESASARVFALDLSRLSIDTDGTLVIAPRADRFGDDVAAWEEVEPIPGGERAYAMAAAQHDGFDDCLYVFGGRREAREGDDKRWLVPVTPDGLSQWRLYEQTWEFNPRRAGSPQGAWRRRADIRSGGETIGLTAGAAVAVGQSHVLLLSGSDGGNLRDAFGERNVGWSNYYDERGVSRHRGFHRQTLSYHAITDTWAGLGPAPLMDDPESGSARQIAANAVTTPAVVWGDQIILPSGEVRPKVRSPKVWAVTLRPVETSFGVINYAVLITYLLAMVGVGFWFMRFNQNTNDYFRGGQNIPWWAAACSIYATMLSSLTFVGLPSKTFAQDWTYFMGNMMIIAVAPIAVFIALPFFRRIDATSAYEYLELRFNVWVRLFGSLSFSLFHLFRMAVVMSLTGLALAATTPLSPAQSVVIMGILCIVYCTLGGIEAVIWTDTIQTAVLLGGGLLALVMLLIGAGGEGLDAAWDAGKFNLAHFNLDVTSAQIALWVILIGAIGQNLSSYTADQAVVQRYMTTPDEKRAARSIWMNAALVLPGSVLFFGLGTALFAYYHQHPEQLDPTRGTDQVLPYYIATQMPVGLAGLIIAGVFAAAQSTVSTSMNSTATTVVTDFLRRFDVCRSERGYLRAAQALTVLIGVTGTGIGLFFVNPEIKSLFDEFLKIIGLFMGVLGGLFVLGVVTQRANGPGAFVGAVVGAGVMFCLGSYTEVNGYLYTSIGITTCFVVGLAASFVLPEKAKPKMGLTLFTLSGGRNGDA
ncbi:MAG: sodium:solute symporter family transporter [Phycisphaeraceae bacterium]